MEKLLTSILFSVVSKFVSEKFLKAFVVKLIMLALEKLKERKFFKNENDEKKLDELITLIEEQLV